MEITLKIPQNDWQQPTEIRQEVVQRFCEYMISRCDYSCWDYKDVYLHKDSDYTFQSSKFCDGKEGIKIHGIEVNAAFEALTKAGYYIFMGTYSDTEHHFYYLSRKPYNKNTKRHTVSELHDFID